MRHSGKVEYISLVLGIGFLLALVSFELIRILNQNDGMLVYALDDPYIHLALAENIWHGHYGINVSEFSAPSSSILWPFLLSPFAKMEWFPLLFNLLCAAATLTLFFNILQFKTASLASVQRLRLVTVVLVMLVLATNMVGLIYTGMEHSLQVLIVCAIGYGLILHAESGRIPPWMWPAIAVAPLIRYEDLSVSAAALLYLLLQRQIVKVFFTSAVIVGCVGLFSYFLMHLGLEPMPSSIVVKSSLVDSKGSLHSIINNVRATLQNKQGIIMVLGTLILLAYTMFTTRLPQRQLAFVTMLALTAHFIGGSYGWFNRYELYIWSFFLLVSIYLFGDLIERAISEQNRPFVEARLMIMVVGIGFIASAEYLKGLSTIPLASNNIYEQQYQMHRFVVDYYKKPIAVNDIGYVAYKNEQMIVDIWGLGSIEAYRYRIKEKNSNWLTKLTEEHGVELAMIYDEYWSNDIPANWIK
ncbi:MAG TPA: hypothetical protein VM553_09295, partial [Dongiaceae bacterium]|nr:hypothetical protein [Dongiaceae bacterium]